MMKTTQLRHYVLPVTSPNNNEDIEDAEKHITYTLLGIFGRFQQPMRDSRNLLDRVLPQGRLYRPMRSSVSDGGLTKSILINGESVNISNSGVGIPDTARARQHGDSHNQSGWIATHNFISIRDS